MATSPKKLLALDTNVLLDLAEGRDFAHDFREVLLTRGYHLHVPPTVLTELSVLAQRGNPAQRLLAREALRRLHGWQLHPFTLSALQAGIAEAFRRRLSARRLIPDMEWNDGPIRAECALGQIPLLATSDKHLLDMDRDALLIAFQEADLLPVHPLHPRRLLRALL